MTLPAERSFLPDYVTQLLKIMAETIKTDDIKEKYTQVLYKGTKKININRLRCSNCFSTLTTTSPVHITHLRHIGTGSCTLTTAFKFATKFISESERLRSPKNEALKREKVTQNVRKIFKTKA